MIRKITNYARKAIKANPRQAKLDSQWYDNAGAWCNALDADYDLQPGTSAGYVAALSPLNSWHDQLHFTPPSIAACLELIRRGHRPHKGIRGPGFFSNRDKAARILLGESPLDVLGGDKVKSFYLNLTGCRESVTIDRHAVRISGWDGKGCSHGVPTANLYKRIAQAYRFAGENLDLSGAEVQALTWSYYRRTDSHFAASNKRKE